MVEGVSGGMVEEVSGGDEMISTPPLSEERSEEGVGGVGGESGTVEEVNSGTVESEGGVDESVPNDQ